jgi:hypothetical protein
LKQINHLILGERRGIEVALKRRKGVNACNKKLKREQQKPAKAAPEAVRGSDLRMTLPHNHLPSACC